MQKDVFGAKGDYTTSPEISQIFGEVGTNWHVTSDKLSFCYRIRTAAGGMGVGWLDGE